MEKRTIIIVWKWSVQRRAHKGGIIVDQKIFCDFIGKNSKFEIQIEDKNSIFFGFTKNNNVIINDELKKTDYTSGEIINFCKEKSPESKVLLFLHTSEPDEFSENDNTYKECQNLNNVKVFTFGGGKGIIYEKLLDQGQTYFRIDAIEDALDSRKFRIKKENFDFVWNSYYSKETIDKLIDLFYLLEDGQKMNSKDLKDEVKENLYGNIREKTLNLFVDDSDENKNEFKNKIRLYITESD